MKSINRPRTLLGIASLFIALSACNEPIDYKVTRDVPLSDGIDIILGDENPTESALEEYEKLASEFDPSIYAKAWTYNATENNIVIDSQKEPEAALAAKYHKLGLGFKEHIAVENRKTLKFQSTSPFSPMDNQGIYSTPLKVNGELYSGLLKGTHIESEEQILEVRFYKGFRIGTFNVWTNLNRLYTKSFKENNKMVIDVNAVRKPIIYLYPEQTQDINIKVNFKGAFTHTYPKYNKQTGWNVQAHPNGLLQDKITGKEYSYLFWEGQSDFKYTLEEGFVVAGNASADFLDEQLAHLGLNRREATDFITYWLPELEKNPYNLIHFSTDEYTQNAPLEITPTPETMIRVFMVYQPLDAPITIPQQQLSSTKRQGYTVVEWGGKKASVPQNAL